MFLANTTSDESVVRASLPASFGGKMPPLPSIFRCDERAEGGGSIRNACDAPVA